MWWIVQMWIAATFGQSLLECIHCVGLDFTPKKRQKYLDKHTVTLRPAWSVTRTIWHTYKAHAHTHFSFSVLSLSRMHSHTNVVSIMAGCCLYNDPIFPDWRGAIGFVCHTKRGSASTSGSPLHTHAHTHPNPSIMASSHRLPVSTEALINWGQALAFVSLGQKRRYMVNFYWRRRAARCSSEMMWFRRAQHEGSKKNIWF